MKSLENKIPNLGVIMSDNLKPKTKQVKDNDGNIVEPNVILETEHEHKDWYNTNQMGRQGGKPNMVQRATKKPKGIRKHSVRKEK